ncbi:MAG: hypothetical protein RLY50_310, partial [Actinomycetota bacterium]
LHDAFHVVMVVGQAGLEPATKGLLVPCSNQLSYWPPRGP